MSELNLNDGEEIRSHNGFPSLVRFFKGDPGKPLVVFFPGWAHLGRISYGIPGSDEEDFLAYWLVEKGYSFLAVSYPIDHPVYTETYPSFTLTDWGDLASGIAAQVISEHDLLNEIIALHWSASGQVVRHFNKACSEQGLSVRFALAMEATPALIVPSDRRAGLKKTDTNMVSLIGSHFELFWAQIEEQEKLNGKQILSKEVYQKEFFGDIPVALTGSDEFFENGGFVKDAGRAVEDKGLFVFDEYPLVAVISGDSALMPYHPIVDRGTWSFLITRKVYHDYFISRWGSGLKMPEQTLGEFVSYVNNLPERLSTTVHGNHFLFVGVIGAQEVAYHLEAFDATVVQVKEEIADSLK